MTDPTTTSEHAPPRLDPYARARHARYFESTCAYHVISRTRSNMFLLRPDLEGEFRRIAAGVHAQAQKRFSDILNCGAAILSNHFHELVVVPSGDTSRLADYMRFIKSEISRRWKIHIGWSGSVFEGYVATAVITAAGQRRALKYVLSQGVKENLVERPEQWPGFHCAESLATGKPIEGYWFNGTDYQRARHAELAKKHPQPVDRKDFEKPRTFSFAKLPAFAGLSDAEYQAMVQTLIEEILEERKKEHGDNPALGVHAICAANPRDGRPIPKPEWFEDRRRMVVWDDLRAPEVQSYLRRYWSFQTGYRVASAQWKSAEMPVAFPEYAFIPGKRQRPIAHMEQSSA